MENKNVNKKYQTQVSSVVFMWFSVVLSLIALLMMFVPQIHYFGRDYAATYNNLFFNGKISSGSIYSIGAWPSFVGYILIAIAVVVIFVLALPTFQPSFETEKIMLFGGIGLNTLGSLLVWFTLIWYAIAQGETNFLGNWDYCYMQPGVYIAGSLSLLSALSCFKAYRIDSK